MLLINLHKMSWVQDHDHRWRVDSGRYTNRANFMQSSVLWSTLRMLLMHFLSTWWHQWNCPCPKALEMNLHQYSNLYTLLPSPPTFSLLPPPSFSLLLPLSPSSFHLRLSLSFLSSSFSPVFPSSLHLSLVPTLQVRVHVVEARKLPGVNLQPVVKVHCGSVIKGTSVQKGTNNPVFDEVLIKWLPHCSDCAVHMQL